MATIYGYLGAAGEKDGAPPSHHVMIATPVGVAPCTDYARSLAATVEMLSRCNIRFDLQLLQGHCHVDDSRNILIRDFLTSKCTDLFFIDADMGWKAQSFLKALRVPGDVVAGVYTHKSDAFTYPFHPPAGVELRPNENGLYEMPKVATGFMRIRRNVVEALYQRERDRGRLSRPGDELGDVRRSPLPVARIVERGFPAELGLEKESGHDLYTSGDYVLCLKARQLGFKLFVDPDMEFGHTGEKVWVGHFGNLYRQRNNLWQPQFAAAVEELRKGNTAPEVFQALCYHYGVADKNYTPWHLPPEAMAELYRQAKDGKGDVLEFGSGLSTLIIGLALDGTERTVHALESDVFFWRSTGSMLEQFKAPNVMLHYLPLIPEDDGTVAYMDAELPESFGLALIDGPAGRYGRIGPVKALSDRIRNAVLIIDDAEREEELLMLLRESTHDFQIKPGERWWAIAHPKVEAVREAAE
jgi:predicted O-methyltransferase YrrM